MGLGSGDVYMEYDLDLDAKGFDVLEAVYECGGSATTTEVKEYTNIEKNAVVHYRFDKLEEQGLVEMGVGESQGNRVPPKKAVLTEEAGQRIADGLFAEADEPTIIERMDRVERQFEALIEDFHELSDEFRQWRYDGEDDRVVDVTEILDRLDEFEKMTEGYGEDALGEALEGADRVEEVEERFTTKGKYFDRNRAFDRNPGGGKVEVEGRDLVVAVESLQTEIDEIVATLDDAGMSPPGEEEFLRDRGGIWG
jgi:hypothetical protein